MSIKSIEIKNFKSIEYLKIDITELNAFVGKNGAGKSTILKSIEYFYDNLLDMNVTNDNFDSNNFHKTKLEITIEYDLSRIIKYANGSYASKLYSLIFNDDYHSNDSFIVRMEQEKNSPIIWNIDYDERYIIYNSNPVYFCNTRALSLTNWDEIWSVVGDLVNAKDVNEISKEFYSSLKSESFFKFSKYVELFEKFLKNNELSIHVNTKKEKIINLLQLQLGGKEFINNNENLDYFSDGTNSQNYILFLSYIAFEISRKRLKDVTVFLDEPELGLHPKMIDELMEKLIFYSNSVKFIIFSHSPRLISYILKNRGELYNVYLDHHYTKIKKIVKTSEEKHSLIISEREASYLFSDFLLFVEGVTEIELFNNKVIQSLFPILKRIDIVNTTSNDHILRLVSPKMNKAEIPYLVLIDLDKLINFQVCDFNSKCRFKIANLWYSPLADNEVENYLKFNYAQPKAKEYLQIKSHIISQERSFYDYEDNFKSISGFEKTYKLINNFCLFNNVYGVRTTIEGTIINKNSNKYISRWRYNQDSTIYKFIKRQKLKNMVIINRLMFSGKTDTLKKYNETDLNKKIGLFESEITKKNTNWISDFFDYYENTVLKQKQYEKDFDNSKRIKRFSTDFPELYDIIKNVSNRISDE